MTADIFFWRTLAFLSPFLISWLVGAASSRRIGEAAGAVAMLAVALVAGWA